MLSHALPVVWQAERAAADGGIMAALAQLRRLGLADFSDVMLAMPGPEFQTLAGLLPRMPDEAVQLALSGSSGKALMHDGVSFMRVVSGAFRDLTGRRLRDAAILDFGCGWGRLLRLLLFFSDPERLAGLDASAAALALCRDHGVPAWLGQCALPADALAVGGRSFDLITGHTVFAHLSRRAMDAAMVALRRVVAEGGVLALTVRPIEFWDFLAQQGDADAAALRTRHLQDGFAFRPREGDVGDCSVDLDWFAARYPQWEVRGADRGWDELRTVLLLTPR